MKKLSQLGLLIILVIVAPSSNLAAAAGGQSEGPFVDGANHFYHRHTQPIVEIIAQRLAQLRD